MGDDAIMDMLEMFNTYDISIDTSPDVWTETQTISENVLTKEFSSYTTTEFLLLLTFVLVLSGILLKFFTGGK